MTPKLLRIIYFSPTLYLQSNTFVMAEFNTESNYLIGIYLISNPFFKDKKISPDDIKS